MGANQSSTTTSTGGVGNPDGGIGDEYTINPDGTVGVSQPDVYSVLSNSMG